MIFEKVAKVVCEGTAHRKENDDENIGYWGREVGGEFSPEHRENAEHPLTPVTLR